MYWALANAAIIAVYTLVDGAGARASGNAPALRRRGSRSSKACPFLAWIRLRRGAARVALHRRAAGGADSLGGAASLAAYAIVLWAMTRAPVAAVAALRETSVLFAALIGAVLAQGRLRPRRGWPARRASSPASPR